MTRRWYRHGGFVRDDRFAAEIDGETVPVEVQQRELVEESDLSRRAPRETVNVAHSGIVSDEVVKYEQPPGRALVPPDIATGEALDAFATSYALERLRGETDESFRERLLEAMLGTGTPRQHGRRQLGDGSDE